LIIINKKSKNNNKHEIIFPFRKKGEESSLINSINYSKGNRSFASAIGKGTYMIQAKTDAGSISVK